jgi:pantoate kinase
MSYEFAETLSLTDGICKDPIASLRAIGMQAGVAMFGHTVFTLVPRSLAKEAREALKGFGGTLFVCNLDPHGARVL